MAIKPVSERAGLPPTVDAGLAQALLQVLQEHGYGINQLIENGLGALLAANNLDDLDDVATARANLGLPTAGSVVQVVFGTTATSATNTNAAYSDTNLSAEITPLFPDSVIIVSARHVFAIGTDGSVNDAGGSWRILRDSTAIMTDLPAGQSVYSPMGASFALTMRGIWSGYAEDEPGAGTFTYKTQHRSIVNGQGRYVTSNINSAPAQIILTEVKT